MSPKVNESVASLKEELKTTLASYQAKRAQITNLHEKLFTTRCELHKAVAQRDRAETARAELQVLGGYFIIAGRFLHLFTQIF